MLCAMADSNLRSVRGDYTRPLALSDEPTEVRRYVNALRRDWRLVAAIVGSATALAFGLSLTIDASYRASARLVFDEVGLLERQDVESLKRELGTLRTLVETRDVLATAAQDFAGLSAAELERNVSTSVDANANIIIVSATGGDAATAAAFANAVADAFLANRSNRERAQLRRARAALSRQLDRLRGSLGAASQIEALRTRINELDVLIAGAGSELQVAERARPPTRPYAPRPFRNALIAFFASELLAVMLVFAREQTRPRINSARELGHLLEAPILARVPWLRARDRRSGVLTGVEYDAYQTLQTSLRHNARTASQTVILVTSAVHSEGKSRVAAALGTSLAQSGVSTLLVSGDLRSPTLHELFGVTSSTGLGEILDRAGHTTGEELRALTAESVHRLRSGLSLIVSSAKRTDAARLLSSDGLEVFFEELRRLSYEYVLIDGTPMLAVADSRLLGRHADSILVVGRPDQLTAHLVLDMREALDTLVVPVLGLVVVGADGEYPAYPVAREAPNVEPESAPRGSRWA
jgi:Mrp family chromosome partitioning ATPase/capsular polysaccharide biosynthesis protein